MAQILKYKQGLTACVTLTIYITIIHVTYKPQSKECHAVSMCSAVIVSECSELFTDVCMCVRVGLHTRVCVCVCVSGSPEYDVWVYFPHVFCAS